MNKKLVLILLVFASIAAEKAGFGKDSNGYTTLSSKAWLKYSVNDLLKFGTEEVINQLESDGYEKCVCDEDGKVNVFKKKSGSYDFFKFTQVSIFCEDKYSRE